MCNSKIIKQLNVSFIWTRTFFDFFRDYSNLPESDRPPFNFFLETSSYKKKFHELQNINMDMNGLTLPWLKGSGKPFWKYYFSTENLESVTVDEVLENIAPFRQSIPIEMDYEALHPNDSISAENFFYKHGIALLITVRLMDSPSLEAAIEKAVVVRDATIFRIVAEEEPQNVYHLNSLSQKLLESGYAAALGQQSGKYFRFPNEPFSISTVINGGEYYRNIPVMQGDEIHLALERLTNWRQITKKDKLEKKKINNIKNEGDYDCLYADRQGRTVWIPRLFTTLDKHQKGYKLGSYHRNLVLASMQVASIGAFYWHWKKNAGGQVHNLGFHLSNWVNRSYDVLLRLSRGDMGKTYRTESARWQIEQNEFIP